MIERKMLTGHTPALLRRKLEDFLARLAQAAPPPRLRRVPARDREDRVQDIFLCCVKNDFRKLRRYVDIGRPFANYLWAIIENFLKDLRRPPAIVPLVVDPPVRTGSVDMAVEAKRILERVNVRFRQLRPLCQALIRAAADGLKPRDIVVIAGLREDQNKEVSDRVRACQKSLRRLLERDGIDLDRFFGGSVNCG